MDSFRVRALPHVYEECYKPQIMMRIIFTCYAINAAALCFFLTLALSCLSSDDLIEKVAMSLFTYTYVAFGPVLLICCFFGLAFMQGLSFQCELSHITTNLNLMDIFIVIGCTLFSALVTLFFSLHKVIDIAQSSLRDENSVFYRVFLGYLKYRRAQRREQQ